MRESAHAHLWREGRLDPAAPQAVPSLIAALVKEKSARIALVLGLIAEGEADLATRTAARSAVRQAIPPCLELVSPRPDRRHPLLLAVFYLLAHFPEKKDAVLTHLRGHGWPRDDDDLLRLERVLSFQEASSAGTVAFMRRLMAVPAASSGEGAWRRIVASILAPLGAEAADAILRAEEGGRALPPS